MKVAIVGLGYVGLPLAMQFERPECYGSRPRRCIAIPTAPIWRA